MNFHNTIQFFFLLLLSKFNGQNLEGGVFKALKQSVSEIRLPEGMKKCLTSTAAPEAAASILYTLNLMNRPRAV